MSVSKVIGLLQFGNAMIVGAVKAFFSVSSGASFSVLNGQYMAGWLFRKRLFSGAASRAKLETKRQNTSCKPKNNRSFANDVGAFSPRTASVVCDIASNRRGCMKCPW